MIAIAGRVRVVVCVAALCTIAESGAFAQSLPAPWTSADIGAPALAGSAAESAATFTVSAAGADIWNSTDQFHFVYQQVEGDLDLRVHVAGQQYIHRWTKSGVMIRESLDAGSRHASTFVTPASGLAFQRRVATGGVSTHTPGTFEAAPHWVRIVRAGNQFTSYVSDDGSTWTLVGTDTIAMRSTVYVGLAAVSHDPARTAMTTFTDLRLEAAGSAPPDDPASPWQNTDVGGPALAGRASESAGTHSVTGAGTDIWNGSDQFHFAYQQASGDVEIVARVVSLEYAHRWSKAGVMIRETLTGPSAHAFMTASAASGWAFQRRPGAGAVSLSSPGSMGQAPGWVKLVRAGDLFSGYESADGVNWRFVGTETIPMAESIFIGLAVTSHNAATTATATFTDVAISEPADPANASPQVSLTAPATDSTFTAPAEVILAASASDTDGTVSRVEFFANGQLLGADTSEPYSFTWGQVPEGTYALTAVATDDVGASSTSSPATIAVRGAPANEPPSTAVTSPSAGSTFTAPATVTVTASASDSDGTVARVDFFANGQPIGSATASPYSFTWSNVAAGSYSLTAVARDDDGATTSSAAVGITVAVPPPAPTQIAFNPSPDHDTAVTSYRVDLYRATDPTSAAPVASSDLGKPAPVNGDIVIDISTVVNPLPAGSYYAVVTAVGDGGSSASAPSAAFTK